MTTCYSDPPVPLTPPIINSNPEVPRNFPDFPRSSRDFHRSSPDFPGGQPLFLGSLTPFPLVASHCAISRDYLSDTPLLRAMGVLGGSPLPPFLSPSPLESMRSGVAIPPPHKRDILAILARYHMKRKQNACNSSLCDTQRGAKGAKNLQGSKNG